MRYVLKHTDSVKKLFKGSFKDTLKLSAQYLFSPDRLVSHLELDALLALLLQQLVHPHPLQTRVPSDVQGTRRMSYADELHSALSPSSEYAEAAEVG